RNSTTRGDDDAGAGCEAKTLDGFRAGDDQRRSAIRQWRRRARRDDTAITERRLQPAEPFEAGVRARPFVGTDRAVGGVDRAQLGIKATVLRGGDRAFVGAKRKRVGVLAADAVDRGDLFGG